MSNYRGFSLVEFIITLGLLSLAAYKGMVFVEGQKREILSVHQDIELQAITQGIRRILQSPRSCQHTFEGLAPITEKGIIEAITNVTTIRNQSMTSLRYRVSQGLENSYGPARLMIESYRLAPSSDLPDSSQLIIEFNRSYALGSSSSALTEVSIPIYFELDESGRIAYCSINPKARTQQFWSMTTDGAIGLPQGRVGVYTSSPRVSFDLVGAVHFVPQADKKACTIQRLGLLQIDHQTKNLIFCDGQKWIKF